jgi:hypothetical protein
LNPRPQFRSSCYLRQGAMVNKQSNVMISYLVLIEYSLEDWINLMFKDSAFGSVRATRFY